MIITISGVEAISTGGTEVFTLMRKGDSRSIGDLVRDPVTDDYYFDVFDIYDEVVLSLDDIKAITWIMEELNK